MAEVDAYHRAILPSLGAEWEVSWGWLYVWNADGTVVVGRRTVVVNPRVTTRDGKRRGMLMFDVDD